MARLQTWDEFDLEPEESVPTPRSDRYHSTFSDDLFPGEPSFNVPRRRTIGRRLATLGLLGCCGWALFKTEAAWWPWLSSKLQTVVDEYRHSSLAVNASVQAPGVSFPPPEAAPLQPVETAPDVATIPGAIPSPPAATPNNLVANVPPTPQDSPKNSENVGVQEAATANLETGALPDPELETTDPVQKRALGAGLHPRLSRVVLTSLSDADFRNAKSAIRKALAETTDADKLVFPLKASAKQAVFQIHFVSGNRRGCRRYVVTIVKNGWTTTAPPMENCDTRNLSSDPPETASKEASGRKQM